MRSKFKYLAVNNQNLFKLYQFNKLVFKKGSTSILPISKIVSEKTTTLFVHNGLKNNKVKLSNFKLLLNDNFFFLRKLKVGNFVFTKKHCVFKKKQRKKK